MGETVACAAVSPHLTNCKQTYKCNVKGSRDRQTETERKRDRDRQADRQADVITVIV